MASSSRAFIVADQGCESRSVKPSHLINNVSTVSIPPPLVWKECERSCSRDRPLRRCSPALFFARGSDATPVQGQGHCDHPTYTSQMKLKRKMGKPTQYYLTRVALGMAPPERHSSSMQRCRSLSEEVSASNPSRATIRHCETYIHMISTWNLDPVGQIIAPA